MRFERRLRGDLPAGLAAAVLDYKRKAAENTGEVATRKASEEVIAAIAPVVPQSAATLLAFIESGDGGVAIGQPTPIFPRLEIEESVA